MTRSSRPPKADNVLQFRPAQSEPPKKGTLSKAIYDELTSPVYSEKFMRVLRLICDKRVEGLLRETHLDELASLLSNLRPDE